MLPSSQNHHALRRLCGGLWGLVLALLVALPALGAQVTEVRIGKHPEFTRVVFELDRPAGYRVERKAGTHGPELTVTLEAGSSARSMPFRTRGISKVVVDGGETSSVAHIALREDGIRVKEMILANPPRIVLDVMRENTPPVARKAKPAPVVAKTPEPKRVAPVVEEKPAPAPKPVAKTPAPAPAPKPVAKTPAPAPKPIVKTPAPAPAPKPVAKTPAPAPAPKPVAKTPAPAPAPKPVAKTPAPAPKPIVEAKPVVAKIPEPAPAEKTPETADTGSALTPPTPAPPGTAPTAAPEKIARTDPPTPKPKPAPIRPVTPKTEPDKPTPASSSADSGGWLSNPLVLGAGAGVLFCLAGFVLLMRRRQPLPNDLDVTAIAESGGYDDSSGAHDTLMGDAGSPPSSGAIDGLFDDAPADAAATQEPSSEPAVAGTPLDDLFDTDADPSAATMMGDSTMNQGMSDLPADPDRVDSPPPPAPVSAAPSGAPDSDVLRVVHELERRMAQLESKLEAANEARDRLERQVAAQSEELRVQRAAIARTQRALRTMSRGDEDKATEPALRDGDTQTKTRVAGD